MLYEVITVEVEVEVVGSDTVAMLAAAGSFGSRLALAIGPDRQSAGNHEYQNT